MTIPCRNSNPFATCWTNPQAMEFVAIDGGAPEQLVARLRSSGWRGQIIGPHGVGKSTLLASLQGAAEDEGRKWVQVTLRDRRTREAWRALRRAPLDVQTLLVVDGFEQLGCVARKLVCWRCLRSGAGLLVTAHQAIGLPTLVELEPKLSVALQVFERVVGSTATFVTSDDAVDAFNACNGNIRDMLFNLYDLHERRRRTTDVANLRRKAAVPMAERPPAVR